MADTVGVDRRSGVERREGETGTPNGWPRVSPSDWIKFALFILTLVSSGTLVKYKVESLEAAFQSQQQVTRELQHDIQELKIQAAASNALLQQLINEQSTRK